VSDYKYVILPLELADQRRYAILQAAAAIYDYSRPDVDAVDTAERLLALIERREAEQQS
jgi:hypothetical protein